jgi:hypothetical protein
MLLINKIGLPCSVHEGLRLDPFNEIANQQLREYGDLLELNEQLSDRQ